MEALIIYCESDALLYFDPVAFFNIIHDIQFHFMKLKNSVYVLLSCNQQKFYYYLHKNQSQEKDKTALLNAFSKDGKI